VKILEQPLKGCSSPICPNLTSNPTLPLNPTSPPNFTSKPHFASSCTGFLVATGPQLGDKSTSSLKLSSRNQSYPYTLGLAIPGGSSLQLPSLLVGESKSSLKLESPSTYPAPLLHPNNPIPAPHAPCSYRPLLVGESEGSLKLESPELGLYEWALKLAGQPTNPEHSLTYSTALGVPEVQVFRFTHWLAEPCEYR